MTRILKSTFAASMLCAAAMTLAGCPTGLASQIPGMGGASAAPSAAPGTNPGTNPSTPANPSANTCTRDTPSGTPGKGGPQHGDYNGQSLPNGYDTAYKTEAEVTAAIRKEDGGGNWACFQKFYPGATTVYARKK